MQPKSSAALPPQIQLLFFNTFSRRPRCPQLWTSDHDPDPRTCPNPPVDRGCLSLSSAPAFDLALWPPTGALRALRNGVAQSPPRVLRGGPDNDFLLRLLVDREHLRPALHVRVWRGRSGFVCLRGREVSSGQREGDGKEQGMLFFFLEEWGREMAAHTCRAKPLQLGLPREAGLKNPPPGVTLLGYRAPAAAAGEQSEAEHRGERGARYGPRLSEMRHRVRDAARAGDKERLCVRARSKTGLKRIAGHAVRERLPSSRVLESGISRHPRRYFFPRKSGQKKKEKRSRDRTPGTENGRVPAARVARARTRTERIGTKDDASLDSAAYLCS